MVNKISISKQTSKRTFFLGRCLQLAGVEISVRKKTPKDSFWANREHKNCSFTSSRIKKQEVHLTSTLEKRNHADSATQPHYSTFQTEPAYRSVYGNHKITWRRYQYGCDASSIRDCSSAFPRALARNRPSLQQGQGVISSTRSLLHNSPG